jgi:hypothetical protein
MIQEKAGELAVKVKEENLNVDNQEISFLAQKEYSRNRIFESETLSPVAEFFVVTGLTTHCNSTVKKAHKFVF